MFAAAAVRQTEKYAWGEVRHSALFPGLCATWGMPKSRQTQRASENERYWFETLALQQGEFSWRIGIGTGIQTALLSLRQHPGSEKSVRSCQCGLALSIPRVG